MIARSSPALKNIENLLLNQLYGANARVSSQLRISGPVHKGINSHVYRVTCERLPYPCALKICLETRTQTPSVRKARFEFRALEKVNAAMPNNSYYKVLQPFLLLESEGALLVGWVNGINLSNQMFRFRNTAIETQKLLDESARWLHCFHASMPMDPDWLDTERKLDILKRNILGEMQINDKVFRQSLDILTHFSAVACSHTVPQSWAYGDFKPDNLILSASAMYGIDISAGAVNLIVYDMGNFLNQIELKLNRFKFTQLTKHREALFHSFLNAYLEESNSVAEEIYLPLLWVRLYTLLHSWAKIRQRGGISLRNRYLEAQYRRVASRVFNELRACS